ncbi:SKA complex subunit 2 [Vanacampus margaritifer]
MEATVEKLELMFSKSEADLNVIEMHLKLDRINHTAENGFSHEENPIVMLERLRAIQDKHCALRSQMTEIAAAQKVSMSSIRDKLNSIIALTQHFERTTGVEVHCMAESVQQLEELLVNSVG